MEGPTADWSRLAGEPQKLGGNPALRPVHRGFAIMNAARALGWGLVVVAVACTSPHETSSPTAIRVADPDAFCRSLFVDLGLRPLSECEEFVRWRDGSRGRYDDLGDEPLETAEELYRREHQSFRAVVWGVTSDSPTVFDGNLDRHADAIEDLPLGTPLVYVVPSSPDEASVDVFAKSGGWMPMERCFEARYVNGWWWITKEYASFAELR